MVLNIVSTKFSNTQRQGRGPSPEVIEVCWDEYPMVHRAGSGGWWFDEWVA